MIKAIYRAREDGDYDFVAAFAEEHDYDEHPANTYAKEIEAEGEEVIVKDFDDLTHLVDVLGTVYVGSYDNKLYATP